MDFNTAYVKKLQAMRHESEATLEESRKLFALMSNYAPVGDKIVEILEDDEAEALREITGLLRKRMDYQRNHIKILEDSVGQLKASEIDYKRDIAKKIEDGLTLEEIFKDDEETVKRTSDEKIIRFRARALSFGILAMFTAPFSRSTSKSLYETSATYSSLVKKVKNIKQMEEEGKRKDIAIARAKEKAEAELSQALKEKGFSEEAADRAAVMPMEIVICGIIESLKNKYGLNEPDDYKQEL